MNPQTTLVGGQLTEHYGRGPDLRDLGQARMLSGFRAAGLHQPADRSDNM